MPFNKETETEVQKRKKKESMLKNKYFRKNYHWCMGFQCNLAVVIIWLRFGLLSFYTPCYFAGLTWIWRLKRNYMDRRQEKKIEGQDIFYILTLLLGSTIIQWVINYSWIQMKYVRLRDKVSKCISRFRV